MRFFYMIVKYFINIVEVENTCDEYESFEGELASYDGVRQ